VTSASACISETDLRGWFEKNSSYLTQNDLFDILKCPERVFNADETSISMDPEVYTSKGSRNVYVKEMSPSKECITVLYNISADGKIAPPMMVFKYVRMPQDILRVTPGYWH
jgi:hypothetical protein